MSIANHTVELWRMAETTLSSGAVQRNPYRVAIGVPCYVEFTPSSQGISGGTQRQTMRGKAVFDVSVANTDIRNDDQIRFGDDLRTQRVLRITGNQAGNFDPDINGLVHVDWEEIENAEK